MKTLVDDIVVHVLSLFMLMMFASFFTPLFLSLFCYCTRLLVICLGQPIISYSFLPFQSCDAPSNELSNQLSDLETVVEELTVTMEKGVFGLGMALEGGKDSPMGDLPIAIKRVFVGEL